MKLLSWNYQGLGNLWIVRSLRKLLKDQGPMVCFLMETRLNKEGFEKHCRDLPLPNKLIIKKPDSGGRLAMLWKREVKVDVINFTENHILAKVVEEDGAAWFLTGFYGWPQSCQKVKSWALLSHLATFVEGPWLCIGDFNAILNSDEKLSSRPPSYNQMDDFREVLDRCSLVDLSFIGYPFIWNNKRPGLANTRECLDSAVATKDWKEMYPECTVTHLHSHASDHVPIILQTKPTRNHFTKSARSFRFEESWLLWEDCEAVVQEAWNIKEGTRSSLTRIKENIKGYGLELQAWGSSKTHPDTDKIKVLQKRVETLGRGVCTEENKVEFLEVSKELDDLLRK
ncbi:uncharacterized protein LOC112037983 [Quercus suber]|uniref:uncharacterized protein LOC112037983 n=1 Tax=Quercus suber TaxID=58331 RepID=UPI000CE2126C|nr:uncharacterized protein LOC112037983 [Quercus suber]